MKKDLLEEAAEEVVEGTFAYAFGHAAGSADVGDVEAVGLLVHSGCLGGVALRCQLGGRRTELGIRMRMGLGQDFPILQGVVLNGAARMAVNTKFYPHLARLTHNDDGLKRVT